MNNSSSNISSRGGAPRGNIARGGIRGRGIGRGAAAAAAALPNRARSLPPLPPTPSSSDRPPTSSANTPSSPLTPDRSPVDRPSPLRQGSSSLSAHSSPGSAPAASATASASSLATSTHTTKSQDSSLPRGKKPPAARALPRVPQAFDYMFVAQLERGPPIDVTLTYRYPHVHSRESSGSSDLFLKSALQFCFPDKESLATQNPEKDDVVEDDFSFVLTDDTGDRRFGYCRRILSSPSTNNNPIALVIVSFSPCFALFTKMLDELVERYTQPKSMDSFLSSVLAHKLPSAGQEFVIRISSAESNEEVEWRVKRPDERDTPLEYLDLRELVQKLSPNNLYRVFVALMAERRVIFLAKQVSVLSSCVQAAMALLYPFHWQHVFIPVLPKELMTILCAPMPYVVGMLTSLVPEMSNYVGAMEAALIVDLDGDCFPQELPQDDSRLVPSSISKPLIRSIKEARGKPRGLLASLRGRTMNKSQSTSAEADTTIKQAFVTAFMTFHTQVLANHWKYVDPSHEDMFDKQRYVAEAPAEMQELIKVLTSTQMFEQFIMQRILRREQRKKEPAMKRLNRHGPTRFSVFEMDNSFLGDELLNKKRTSSPTKARRHASLSVPKKLARSALSTVNFAESSDKSPTSPETSQVNQEDLLKALKPRLESSNLPSGRPVGRARTGSVSGTEGSSVGKSVSTALADRRSKEMKSRTLSGGFSAISVSKSPPLKALPPPPPSATSNSATEKPFKSDLNMERKLEKVLSSRLPKMVSQSNATHAASTVESPKRPVQHGGLLNRKVFRARHASLPSGARAQPGPPRKVLPPVPSGKLPSASASTASVAKEAQPPILFGKPPSSAGKPLKSGKPPKGMKPAKKLSHAPPKPGVPGAPVTLDQLNKPALRPVSLAAPANASHTTAGTVTNASVSSSVTPPTSVTASTTTTLRPTPAMIRPPPPTRPLPPVTGAGSTTTAPPGGGGSDNPPVIHHTRPAVRGVARGRARGGPPAVRVRANPANRLTAENKIKTLT
eukprot:CAMPEP_0177675270 /NCGR_PEP_ID=MMETSP0447-20121125/27092_1 /TAXON_ID=0 /ORGANISM="Stygamoeba regulata, Strain BSH-02190019" /LENGTH=1012 /DNA_ID=CAMNT_0019183607 /DNA_START=82 /DNA_END=3116 /DNA_ORIENTATION=-